MPRLLVCVKQVPDMENAGGGELKMNRFDEFAVEQGLRITEAICDSTLDVITVGPESSAAVVKRALGMGAGHAIHILTLHNEHVDPYVTAASMAARARLGGYDLVLAGAMSEDAMGGQVAAMAAALLDFACATLAVAVNVWPQRRIVRVEREIEGGARQVLDLRLPAVVTVQTGINTPRYPTLSNLLKANRYPIETVAIDDLGRFEPRQRLIGTSVPAKRRNGRFLSGTTADKANSLLTCLTEKGFIRR
jgi:electron transfer flavoprotein beta subunit